MPRQSASPTRRPRRRSLFALAGLFAAVPPPGIIELDVHWSGPPEVIPLVETGSVRPLSLAPGDFNEDGVEDVVAGYASGRSGVVALFVGNGAARVVGPVEERAAGGGLAGTPPLIGSAAPHSDSLPLTSLKRRGAAASRPGPPVCSNAVL